MPIFSRTYNGPAGASSITSPELVYVTRILGVWREGKGYTQRIETPGNLGFLYYSPSGRISFLIPFNIDGETVQVLFESPGIPPPPPPPVPPDPPPDPPPPPLPTPDNFDILNQASGGFINDVQPLFYTPFIGLFPMAHGTEAVVTQSGFAGSITVNVSLAAGVRYLRFLINAVLVYCGPAVEGNNYLPSMSFLSTDSVQLVFSDNSC